MYFAIVVSIVLCVQNVVNLLQIVFVIYGLPEGGVHYNFTTIGDMAFCYTLVIATEQIKFVRTESIEL